MWPETLTGVGSVCWLEPLLLFGPQGQIRGDGYFMNKVLMESLLQVHLLYLKGCFYQYIMHFRAQAPLPLAFL